MASWPEAWLMFTRVESSCCRICGRSKVTPGTARKYYRAAERYSDRRTTKSLLLRSLLRISRRLACAVPPPRGTQTVGRSKVFGSARSYEFHGKDRDTNYLLRKRVCLDYVSLSLTTRFLFPFLTCVFSFHFEHSVTRLFNGSGFSLPLETDLGRSVCFFL
jgi:hypothetical protein